MQGSIMPTNKINTKDIILAEEGQLDKKEIILKQRKDSQIRMRYRYASFDGANQQDKFRRDNTKRRSTSRIRMR